jgi:hypothetical protein
MPFNRYDDRESRRGGDGFAQDGHSRLAFAWATVGNALAWFFKEQRL